MKSILLMAALAVAMAPALALERGTTDLGQAFVSGGVGAAERGTLDLERSGYDLEVLTAAGRSGNYLADVHIRITDSQSKQVLDTLMDGPWLLIDLPAGRYQVEAVRGNRVQRHFVALLAGAHRQTVFYFDNQIEDDASPALIARPSL